MIGRLIPRFDTLSAAQRRLWPELRPSLRLGFVLYGGTAISVHLGHRRSVDFDFFRDERLDKDAIRASFPFMRRAATLQDAPDTLVVLVPAPGRRSVKISFFGGLTLGRFGDPLLTADGVLEVASLDDLMAHKLKVILQRPERKDYEDLAAMIRAGCSVARGLSGARLLFGRTFQPAESLKAMVYFGDGNLAGLAREDRNTLIAAASATGELPAMRLRSKRLAAPAAGRRGRARS
ncbi:MAG: nucleotidyl transferase AbiEii/AbiGii toxin family protein [Burkholderiales bacterium]